MGYLRDNHKINVVYDDGQIDQFERTDGWAEIGIDAIRGMGGPSYDGRERRTHCKLLPALVNLAQWQGKEEA